MLAHPVLDEAGLEVLVEALHAEGQHGFLAVDGPRSSVGFRASIELDGHHLLGAFLLVVQNQFLGMGLGLVCGETRNESILYVYSD